jgi:hypothetical protein
MAWASGRLKFMRITKKIFSYSVSTLTTWMGTSSVATRDQTRAAPHKAGSSFLGAAVKAERLSRGGN